jgi:hypothetical protein
MNVDDFTMLLADRLAAIVPAGFHVQAGNGQLWYSADEGRFPGQSGDYYIGQAGTDMRTNFGAYGEADAGNIIGLAILALDGLQDFIDEATHDPWPGTRTPPRPHAQIRGPMLHMWYGERDNVVLACN